MGGRLEMHGKLLELAPKAYYQPISNQKLEYPCFVYHLSKIPQQYADNKVYKRYTRYSVAYICQTSNDTKVYEVLDKFQYCTFDRHYSADNLHHYVFDLYY